jgi:hypothetical protein
MKFAFSMLSILLLFAITACRSLQDAKTPEEAARFLNYPIQEDVQNIFDSIVSNADHLLVDHITWTPSNPKTLTRVKLFETKSTGDIKSLSKSIRIKIPLPIKIVVDGHEGWSTSTSKLDACDWFQLTLSKNGKTLLTFQIYDDEHIGIEALVNDSVIAVDNGAMAHFYSRLQTTQQSLQKTKKGEQRAPVKDSERRSPS